MKYFSIRTNDQNTIGKILNRERNVVFDTLSWHKNEISIGDIVFIVISGDNSKKLYEYENGLKAIGKVKELPNDEKDKKHFTLDVEIFEFLSKTLTKDDFYLFPSLKDAPNIGPDTKSAPNQAFRRIEEETGKAIIRAVIDLLKNELDISKYKIIVDNSFKIDKLILETTILDSTTINSSSKSANIIPAKFVEWFEKPENYKKSYEGLVNIKILNFWNESYFKKALFTIDLNDIDRSLFKIDNLISDKSNLEWKSYSNATSKGAPEAVLGKNNYLKFLSEFVTDNENIELLRDFSNTNVKKYFDIRSFQIKLNESGLIFTPQLIQRFIASLCTKPFVICSGLSGSGKTKLSQAFVQWITENEKQYKIIPVGADWTNREPLLGYPNGLDEKIYVTPDSGALQLIIDASKEENQNKPYFMILDEMNLSHVERYLADFLSIMESGDSIKLYSGADRVDSNGNKIDQEIFWPNNLFIIGTVNIDETTYMFSPKVLDRANVIEFRITPEEMDKFFKDRKELNMKELFLDKDKYNGGAGQNMAAIFLQLAKDKTVNKIPEIDGDENVLNKFFKELQIAGLEFGFRSAIEIELLITKLFINGLLDEQGQSLNNNAKIDIAIMQKLLPKMHGSRNKLTKVLPILGGLCLTDNSNIKENYLDKFVSNSLTEVELKADINIKYKISFEKICRMYKNAVENGFASYAEA